ncbi:hypothetical protein YC2023_017112 [Brassica napus]
MRKVLYHSRRSFSGVVSKAHASLLAMSCASAAVMDLKLKNTVFEFSYSEAVDALNNPLEFSFLATIECSLSTVSSERSNSRRISRSSVSITQYNLDCDNISVTSASSSRSRRDLDCRESYILAKQIRGIFSIPINPSSSSLRKHMKLPQHPSSREQRVLLARLEYKFLLAIPAKFVYLTPFTIDSTITEFDQFPE